MTQDKTEKDAFMASMFYNTIRYSGLFFGVASAVSYVEDKPFIGKLIVGAGLYLAGSVVPTAVALLNSKNTLDLAFSIDKKVNSLLEQKKDQ